MNQVDPASDSGGPARDIVYAPATISRAAVSVVSSGDFFRFADRFGQEAPR